MRLSHRFALLAVSLSCALACHAAAPEAGGQAPGWFRLQLGKFEVTALNDGTFELPMDKLLKTDPKNVAQALHRDFLGLPVTTSVNGFLVNTGTKLVLIDTGTGAPGPAVGRLVANLEASGYKPEQVDEVLITHMHGDHIGGLTHDGQRVFPNAVVRIAKADTDYWLSEAAMAKAPEDARGGFKTAMAVLKPYIDAGALKPFDASAELEPGIHALITAGHTPGHAIYRITSEGKTLVLWGDLIHSASVQFPDPDVTIAFDSDPATARIQRRKAFAEAAQSGELDGAAHLSFPGLGHLRADGKGYDWVPLVHPGNAPAKP
ncbi:MAG: MBL fold metallo-hydrolase [Pelomonas sp.]|nr:MBL fold metallo-hydrolase [Roseateles sp.]